MNRKQQTKIKKEQSFLPLMKFESSTALLMEPGITTINFFSDGNNKIDYDTSLRMLKSRMKNICEANPWLVGRLVRNKQKHKGLLCCAYPRNISNDDIDAIFVTTNLDEMKSLSSSVTPYPEITKAMKKSGAIVKTGHQLINKSDRVTKLTFLPIANGNEYALSFSIAHAVADGFTYYRIFSMLSNKSAIESLQEKRVQNFEASTIESIGLKEQKFLHSPWLLGNVISRWAFSSPMQVSANFVDADKISKVKEDAKNRHSEDPNFYVSTNDILTSSFGRESKVDALLMAFNLRGRHADATESHAGNYESVLYYDEESFKTPDVIRESLRNGAPYKRFSGNELPSWSKQLRFKFSFITSWSFSYFNADLHLWDSQEGTSSSHLVKLHLPIYDVYGIPPVPMGIIFKPCNGKLALMYFYPSKNKFYKDKDNTNSCLGDTVNEVIFAN